MPTTVLRGVITGRSTRARTLLLTLVALLFVAGGPFPAWVAAAAPASANGVTVGANAVVTNTDGDPIRIREGASIERARIAWAREGDVVSVLAGPVNDDSGIVWFNVQAAEVKGWMMALYLRGTGSGSPAAAAATAAARLSGNARVANTDGDRLRVRSTPASSGAVIGYLDPGVTVAIQEGPLTDAAGIVWYRVRADRLGGWCMAQYLAPADAPQAAPARRNAEAEPDANRETVNRVSHAQLRQWIDEARAMYPYPESTDKMWRVMMCESTGYPGAVGSGIYYGLFQYLPSTWAGSWNPYRNESIWDARSQIFATARAWSIGMQSHWSCYYLTGAD